MGGDGKFSIDLNDEVIRGSLISHNGEILPPVPRAMPPPAAPPAPKVEEQVVAITPWQKASREVAVITAGMGSAVALGKATGTAFMDSFFTFGLAGLVGYRVVWGVAPALHSPLMSVTNAISGLVRTCSVYEFFEANSFLHCRSVLLVCLSWVEVTFREPSLKALVLSPFCSPVSTSEVALF